MRRRLLLIGAGGLAVVYILTHQPPPPTTPRTITNQDAIMACEVKFSMMLPNTYFSRKLATTTAPQQGAWTCDFTDEAGLSYTMSLQNLRYDQQNNLSWDHEQVTLPSR